MKPFVFIIDKDFKISWCDPKEMKNHFGDNYNEINFKDLFLRSKNLTALLRWMISNNEGNHFKSQLVSSFNNSEFSCSVTRCNEHFSIKLIQKEDEDVFTKLFWSHFTRTFPGGILCVDKDLAVVEISNIVVEIFDAKNRDGITFSKNSLIGKKYSILFGQQYIDIMSRFKDAVITAREERKITERIFNISQRKIKMLFGSLSEKNEYTGCCIYMFDITEESKKSKLIKEQELLLYQSSKMASLGEMAGGIAHEINNPLTILKGNVEILTKLINRGKLNEEILLEDLGKMNKTIDRIATIVSGMSTISRDSTNEKMGECTVREIIDDIMGISRDKQKRSGFEVVLKVDDGLLDKKVFCKRVQISQVLVNILNNAIDALQEVKTPDFESILDFKIYQEEDKVVFLTRDNGVSIPDGIINKIFEPFFTTKDIGKGTGLGLSVSAKMIKEHGSNLCIEQIDGNKDFSFSLKLVE